MRASLLLFVPFVFACSSASQGAADTASTDTPDAGVEGPADAGVDARAATDASDAAPVDPTVAVPAFDSAAAAKICAKLTSCCSEADYKAYLTSFSGPPFTLKAGALPPLAECQKTVQAQLSGLHDKWLASIKRGRMSFDPTKAAACLAAVDAAQCGPSLSKAVMDDTCFGVRGNEVFQKRAKPGDACEDIGDSTYYGECNPTLGYCDGPATKVPNRTCVPWRKQGEACAAVPKWEFCDTRNGAVCEGATMTTEGKCSRPGKTIALGGACGAISGPIDECAAGTTCDDATLKCVPQRKDGEACKWNYECASNYPFSCFPADPMGAGGKCGSTAFCGGH